MESGEDRGWIFSESVRDLRAKAWMWWIWGEAVRVLRMLEPCLSSDFVVRLIVFRLLVFLMIAYD